VNPAEVVVREVQAVRSPQILPFFAEGIRQPRKAAHLHSDGEILALHDGSADTGGIAMAEDWDHLRIKDFSGRILALAFRRLALDLDELSEAGNPIFQGIRDRSDVGLESVRSDLELLTRCSRAAKPFNEDLGGCSVAPSEGEVQNELCIALDCHETILISDAVVMGFLRSLVGFLLSDIGPNFVTFNILAGNIHDKTAHDLLALLADHHHELQDRIAVNAGKPARCCARWHLPPGV
jgi:hypothetical protein